MSTDAETEKKRLASLQSHGILDTETDAYLEYLVQRAARKLRMPIALVNLIDADRQWSKAAVGLPGGFEIARANSFCTHTIKTPKELTIIADARLDPRVADNPLVTGNPRVRFYAGAPITDDEGLALGAICVVDTRVREFSEADIETLKDLATSVSARLQLYLANAERREIEEDLRVTAALNPYMPWTASAEGEPDEPRRSWPARVFMPTDTEPRQSWLQAVHPDDHAAALAAWQACLGSGDPLDMEYRLRLTDGDYRWFRVRAVPKRDLAGAIMRWYGTVEDIEDRKQAAATQQDAEKLLRRALDAARFQTWELDLASRRLTASDVSVVNFGLELGVEQTSFDGALARIHPDDALRYGREVEQAWASGKELEIEYRSLWPDGTTHWIRIVGHPTRDEAGKPARLVGLSLDITEQRQAEQERQRAEARVEYLAHHDTLTGIPNRRLFLHTLASALEEAGEAVKTALLRIEIDDFNAVNDAMGNDAGDALLKHAADRLQQCMHPAELLARFATSEFAAIMTDVTDLAEIDRRAQALLTSLQEPATIGDRTIILDGSIGISVAPEDAADTEQLLRNAGSALHRTRNADKGKFHYFDAGMDAHLQDRAKLRVDLRGALDRREFEMFYQPQIDLKSGRISSFEALIRWHHPSRGIVSPVEFISMAEETGAILGIGKWVLEEATREAANWPDPVGVAINLSPVQFRATLVEEVGNAAAKAGLSPERIELEVTESVLLQDSEGTAKILRDLQRTGMRMSMDDFGSGYSSLGYLRRFPFNKIKIDKSLLDDLPDGDGGSAVVQAIVGLAHSLGISVTAEGVERQEQLEFLRSLGCDHAQGFYFSKPVPASEVAALLAADAATGGPGEPSA